MYKIIGADGREYGPIDLAQLRQWVADGRLNAQSKVRPEGASDWKAASEIPELQQMLSSGAAAGSPPPPVQPPPLQGEEKGLAITSLVLGILSFVCFGILTGIPAIICGHIARGRTKRSPAQYGGAGMALAGLIMGYLSIVITFLILPAMLLPALSKAKSRAQEINCVNNLKQIGLAFKTWELDHDNAFPFNVSTKSGGTLELCAPAADGFENNPALHFQVLSNELFSPRVLVCVADPSKQPAADFQTLGPANVSYRLRTGSNVTGANPQQLLAICPIHGHQLFCDGSVQRGSRHR